MPCRWPSSTRSAVLGAAVHLFAAGRASDVRGFMGLIPNDVIDELPRVYRQSEPGREREDV